MKTRKALIVSDMVNVYIYGKKPLIPIEARSNMVANIKKSIAFARKNSIPIIYVNSAFKKSDPIFKLINYRAQATEENDGLQIIDELKPQQQDYIIKKRGFDAFWKSGLEHLLKKLKIKAIYLTGCQTDCCIRETAVTASHLGYDVFVLQDCCQTNREFGQVAALRFLKMCTKDIITSKDLRTHFSS